MKTKLYLIIATVLVIVGCTTTKLVENPPGSGKFEKVVDVDPKLQAALDAANSINEASKPFNTFSGAVAIGLTTIASFATWFARRKTAQLNATIAGVEAKGGSDVKAAIKSAAMAAGVENSLNKAVKSVTG